MGLYEEIEKIFHAIEKDISKENLKEFKNTSLGNLYLYHFSLGMWIRNNFLHPKNRTLHNLFMKNGIFNEDDMSSIIIQLFHHNISRKI